LWECPSFGEGNFTVESNDSQSERQDVFIAGYLDSDSEGNPLNATSVIVTGALQCAEGSIWVGAEKSNTANNHYESLRQFAVFDDTIMERDDSGNYNKVKMSESELNETFAAFTNAYDKQYHAIAGDNVQCLYWDGVKGKRQVILRKIDGETSKSLEGAQFNIYKADRVTPVVIDDKALTDLTSQENGVFFVGELSYGSYYVKEINAPSGYTPEEYTLTIDDNGILFNLEDTKSS
jgi:uncharacterized surface anchored protein